MFSRIILKDTGELHLVASFHTTKLVRLRDKPQPNIFRVQALPYGDWVHPNDTTQRLVVNERIVDSIIRNFDDHVMDSIPVPLTHTDDPSKNTGKVIAAIKAEDGLDLVLEIDKPEIVADIDKGLIGGVSLSFDTEYMDKKTGQLCGPTMIHCALVSHSYIKGMRKFARIDDDELAALGISGGQMKIAAGDSVAQVLFLSDVKPASGGTGDSGMTKEEMLAALKKEHQIDVAQLQDTAKAHASLLSQLSEIGKVFGLTVEKPEHVGQLSDKVKAAQADAVELGEVRAAVAAKVQLADGQKLKDVITKHVDQTVALGDRVALLEAEKDVDALLADKKILPAQREEYIELRKSNKGLYDKMTGKLKAGGAVDLSEHGIDTNAGKTDDTTGAGKTGSVKLSDDQVKGEIDRYLKLGDSLRGPGMSGVVAKRRQLGFLKVAE